MFSTKFGINKKLSNGSEDNEDKKAKPQEDDRLEAMRRRLKKMNKELSNFPGGK